jgi:hypothetical protein
MDTQAAASWAASVVVFRSPGAPYEAKMRADPLNLFDGVDGGGFKRQLINGGSAAKT